MDIASDAVVARNARAIAERIGDETVILEPEADRYVRLNRSGTELWEELGSPTSLARLAARLETSFGLDPERALADATAFVSELRTRALVELS